MSAERAFLEHLDSLGVVISTARPAADGSEFTRSTGWQALDHSGNAARLKAWQPGHALLGVMGGRVTVLDVDTKNGADPAKVAALLDGIGVRIYADVLTPSGGRHYYVAGHPDLPTVHATEGRDGLTGYPGVEVLSFGANAFLPGTVRPKYGGAGYVILSDDLERLADGGDDDSAEALTEWVAAHRASRGEAFTPSPPWDGAPPDKRQAAYLEAVLTRQADELAGMRPDSGRNYAVYLAGLKCGSFVAGAGMDEAQVVARLTDAAQRCGLVADDGPKSVAASIQSGLLNGRQNPRAVPPAKGDDLSWVGARVDLATGEVLEASQDDPGEQHDTGTRRLVLVAADSIKPRPVFWLWDGRLALGTLGLLAGREGLGKSTLGYWTAARVTRGELEGTHRGVPKSVLVCATEDSWEHTIVPRLIAAGADLARVFRVEVLNALDIHVGLSLPRDLVALERAAGETDAALLLLDPLMSRLGDLDTHRDAEVRQALEPLVAIADRTGMAVLGVIHHNKSGSTDPLQLVMGSKAFTAVARSVHTVVPDPDDESDTRRLFGTPKNNLGRADLPTLSFAVVSHPIDTDEGTAWTGRLEWGEEMAGSIGDAMRRAADTPDDKSAASEAGDWLTDHLAIQGGTDDSASIKRAGQKAGHSPDALKRARRRIGATLTSEGFPRRTFWTLGTGEPQSEHSPPQSEQQSEQPPRGENLTALTAPTEHSGSSGCSWSSPDGPTPTAAPTGPLTLALAAHPGQDEDNLAEMLEELGGACSTCSRFICICQATA